ncbi:hypothetical protein SAMN05444159_0299 [Bradyrhizobium lablabi]|uniref:Invasion protein IalB, involved in pathogenesis n=1 Tax=Bradyrhizobium lablabi TaxID=722472 RepID=A0A1M6IC71_9BRAD|nr:hypothetical protein [Bradyrhizobium lablabi]SHJ32051.1 hypothetical protein SAMN05444159_0299 [Bradyrhizobium lablabi]
MFISTAGWSGRFGLALASLIAAGACSIALAAPVEKSVAGKQLHFPEGHWSALPQVGPDGKVRQCVLVALRQRTGKDGPVDTHFSLNISRGSGLTFAIQDDGLPMEEVLDDQAEILIDNTAFPAVGFPVANVAFAFHPGDAAGSLAALRKAMHITLRSDGAGIDSGAVNIDLPAEAVSWLRQCGKTFDIPIDKPTDPNAPDMPVPRQRSAKIAIMPATPAGAPGIEDKQKIEGWNASELRGSDGSIQACYIRRHYLLTGSEPFSRTLGTLLMLSRRQGLIVVLKDSKLDLPEGQPVEATLKVGEEPFTAFSAHVVGHDEIGIYPQHATTLATVLEKGAQLIFKAAPSDRMEFPVQAGVVPWLRACARRNGISIEPVGQ